MIYKCPLTEFIFIMRYCARITPVLLTNYNCFSAFCIIWINGPSQLLQPSVRLAQRAKMELKWPWKQSRTYFEINFTIWIQKGLLNLLCKSLSAIKIPHPAVYVRYYFAEHLLNRRLFHSVLKNTEYNWIPPWSRLIKTYALLDRYLR